MGWQAICSLVCVCLFQRIQCISFDAQADQKSCHRSFAIRGPIPFIHKNEWTNERTNERPGQVTGSKSVSAHNKRRLSLFLLLASMDYHFRINERLANERIIAFFWAD